MTEIFIFSALMLVFGVYAVMSRSVLRSAIGLAFCSAALAMVFYNMGEQLVAMFELSVCSGLVTVVFIAGISLSRSPKQELMKEYDDKKRNMGLPILLIVAGAVMLLIAVFVGSEGLDMAIIDDSGVKQTLWQERQADIWGQMAAILCGGVAITVLFREEKKGK